MDIYTLQRIEDLIEGSEISIDGVDIDNKILSVLLPYETAAVVIELEGSNDDEIIESFKAGVNHRLDSMIDHLNECKFS